MADDDHMDSKRILIILIAHLFFTLLGNNRSPSCQFLDYSMAKEVDQLW